MSSTTLGLILTPAVPPERIVELSRSAEDAGIEEVWVFEDCFQQSGLGPAAAVLGATSRIRVGLGLMPVPLRSVALTAMEIATLGRMFPGRFLPGIGHGVLSWMGQAGVRAKSPLTLLREQSVTLRRLLRGEQVTMTGEYVQLDRVQLSWLPNPLPPILIGATRSKTLALAGELGDGLILAGNHEGGPAELAAAVQVALDARAAAEVTAPFDVVAFRDVPVGATSDDIGALAATHSYATRMPIASMHADGSYDNGANLRGLIAAIAAAR